MEAVVLPNRGAVLVRKKGRKFKRRTQALDPSKSSDSEEEEDEDKNKSRRKSVRKIPKGAMLKHYHNQKRMYLGKEVRKFFRSRHFQLRLALADEEMQQETVTPLKPTVW